MAKPHPARHPARDSRQAIFAAAAVEFAERGFDAAGVDRIADKARVNKAMIYYHFGSKLGLYLEILRDMFRAVGARARAIADGPGPPDEKLDIWIATVVAEASARPYFPPIMLRELASGAPHFDPETVGLMDAVVHGVRDIIVQGQRQGFFRDVDPLLMHLTIMPAVMVFIVRARALKRVKRGSGIAAPLTEEDFVRHMQQVVRRSLKA